MSLACPWKIVVAGQPNVGKSTFINTVIGSYVSHVANWPGVTVSIKVIEAELDGNKFCLIDLPGTYSLSGGSEEEKIAAKFLIKEEYDSVIIVLDAVALKRTMYLALQILELRGKGIIAINKVDRALRTGIHVNKSLLEKRLQRSVVEMSAARGTGVEEVLKLALKEQQEKYIRINYGDLEYYITELERELYGKVPGNPRWFAAEFMLGNEIVEEELKKVEVYEKALKLRESARRELGELEKIVVESRWKKINEILKGVIEIEKVIIEPKNKLLKLLDEIMFHPIAGMLASFFILFSIMTLAFTVNTGFPLNVIAELSGLDQLAEAIESYSISSILSNFFDTIARATKSSVSGPLGSLIGEGVILGVGTVLSFFPLVFTVHLLLALLEDSGLAARIAVAKDPLFRPVGLNGKAVFPIVISMGCNVAGVPASRVMRSGNSKLASIMALPLIPCQARLVVLLALASALPGSLKVLSVFYVYVLSIILFLLVAYVVKRSIGLDEVEEIVMELPPYHVPKLGVVSWMAWDNAKHFIQKAGTVILAFSIMLWLLTNVGPTGLTASVEESWSALIGKTLEFIPAVVLEAPKSSAWVISLSMFVGTIAKEVVLETMAILTGTSNLSQVVNKLGLGAPQVIALMVAITLYVPCIATVAVIKSETGSWKWTLLSVIISIILSIVFSHLTLKILQVLY